MKSFNHKEILNLVYGASIHLNTEVTKDGVQEARAISPKQLPRLIEIAKDCGCHRCQLIASGFTLALTASERGDIDEASIMMSVTCEHLTMLTIPALKGIEKL